MHLCNETVTIKKNESDNGGVLQWANSRPARSFHSLPLIVHLLKVLDEKFDEHPYFCVDELGTAVRKC